jgi:exo-1,4-beta-D-glucosaminidase
MLARFLLAASATLVASGSALAQPRIALETGWSLQSSAKVADRGDTISTPAFRPRQWIAASVPTTVVGALVTTKLLPDPTVGMNLRSFEGVSYPIGKNFSNFPMPEKSPYAVPWWYRKQFTLPAAYAGRTVWLHFGGINYAANVWLNGKKVASELAGAYRTHELDVTAAAKPGAVNVLAVEVRAPTEHELAITFVDWNPAPPDRAMGLWREVYLEATGPVAIRYPAVLTSLAADHSQARLTVTARLTNASGAEVKGTLGGTVDGRELSQPVTLAAHEEREVVFEPVKYPALEVKAPKLWWPAQMGTPALSKLSLRFTADGDKRASHEVSREFGIRTITSTLDAQKKRLFSVNGRRVLIRGGGWSSDFLLRYDARKVEDQLRYVRDMGLNTVRLEGKLEPEHFFDLTDRMGILVLAGWCCCDHWEKWKAWKPGDLPIAEQSLRDQIHRLRAHPSVAAWLNGSDHPPPPEVEKAYLRIETDARWPNPIISSATAEVTPVSGPSGVKMSGPYEWIPPRYWLEDTSRGGAHGFNSETSPGPAVPPVESLRRMLPPDHLWPIDEVWNYHAGGDVFTNVGVFSDALSKRYGAPTGLEDFAAKSQLMAYEGIRAMFEAYSRNKYTSTGVIQWMLNNAWPSLIWHLFDYYLRPGGGYFAAKKACEPLHPIYSYTDGTVWVVNSRYEEARGLALTAQVLGLDGKEQTSRSVPVDVPADGAVKLFALPPPAGSVSFVRLTLADASGAIVGSSFYWLSGKAETLDWNKSSWYMTPASSFADFTALATMPKVKLAVTSKTAREGDDSVTRVTVRNGDAGLAFFVRLKLSRGKDREEVLPVLWSDNYVSLLPGESRELVARVRRSDLGAGAPVVEASGWNVTR